jgi:sarcosine oxidase, subunit delta
VVRAAQRGQFRYGGEPHIARPTDPAALDDAAWAEYLFMRANPKGVLAERWVPSAGCRRWFNLLRDTVSHRILASYTIGETTPGRGGTQRPNSRPGS